MLGSFKIFDRLFGSAFGLWADAVSSECTSTPHEHLLPHRALAEATEEATHLHRLAARRRHLHQAAHLLAARHLVVLHLPRARLVQVAPLMAPLTGAHRRLAVRSLRRQLLMTQSSTASMMRRGASMQFDS